MWKQSIYIYIYIEESINSGAEDAADHFGSGIIRRASSAAAHEFLSSLNLLFNMYSASSGSFPKYQESSSATNF